MAIGIELFVVTVRTLIKNIDIIDYTFGISIDLFYKGYALGI